MSGRGWTGSEVFALFALIAGALGLTLLLLFAGFTVLAFWNVFASALTIGVIAWALFRVTHRGSGRRIGSGRR